MDDCPIAQPDWYSLIFAADANEDAFQHSILAERSIAKGFRAHTPRERDYLRPIPIEQLTDGAVGRQHRVDFSLSLESFWVAFAPSDPKKAPGDFGLGLRVNPTDERCTAFVDLHEVHSFGLAQ
jgi:hypothetical protein